MLLGQGKKRLGFIQLAKLAKHLSKRPEILFITIIVLVLAAAAPAYPEDILDLHDPAYSECGNVSINGYVNIDPPAFGLVWDWGDGSKTVSWFPASHRYAANGTFTVTVTAAACNTLTKTKITQVTNAEIPGCPPVGARTFYNLKPYNIHLNEGQTSGVPLHVVDQDGNPASGTPTFSIWDPPTPALISIDSSGYVTALRPEYTAAEIGVWVNATLSGGPSVSNSSVVRVLPEGYSIPAFAEVIGENTVLYYPATVNGEDIEALVSQFQIPTVNEYAYQIENRLMATNPFSGARQVFEVDFGITETNRVCGISGNPIRLGWNLGGNEWQNCFLVPFPVSYPPLPPPPARSPQWGVFYHELGHNMLGASPVFDKGLGHFFYSEGLASAMSLSVMEEILGNPAKYPIEESASLSLQWIYNRDAANFLNARLAYLAPGLDFSGMSPDIVDGIWLYHKAGVPHFADRFFLPLQPLSIADLGGVLCSVQTAGDNGKHTFFAALMSAAAGTDLYDTFLNDYHYPLVQPLYDTAYAALKGIIAQRECPGDLDRNGSCDSADLAAFAANFGKNTCSGGCAGDFNTDGDVDGTELAAFISKFGRTDCL